MRDPFCMFPASVSASPTGAALVSPPLPAWPPQVPNALYLHPGMTHTTDGTFTVTEQDGSEGPTRDIVTSITFANGITMVATGTGDPVTIDADGLHFSSGQYLSFPLGTTLRYSGFAAFARISRNPIPQGTISTTRQQPIAVTSSKIPYLLAFNSGQFRLYIDLGVIGNMNVPVSREEFGEVAETGQFTFGMEHDATPEGRSSYGNTSMWLNHRVMRADNFTEVIEASEWVVGRDFGGAIHEGVVFFRREGDEHSLFPPGGSGGWAMNNLEQQGDE